MPADRTSTPQVRESAPPPKPARGVKIAVGVATALLALLTLAVWGLIRAFAP